MSRSTDQTRRDFLIRLAKAAAFVPPALATLDVERAAAALRQGGGKGTSGNSGSGGGKGTDGNTGNGAGNSIGSLSTSGQAVEASSFRTRGQTADRQAPWNPGASSPAPWQRPPPSSSGGD